MMLIFHQLSQFWEMTSRLLDLPYSKEKALHSRGWGQGFYLIRVVVSGKYSQCTTVQMKAI